MHPMLEVSKEEKQVRMSSMLHMLYMLRSVLRTYPKDCTIHFNRRHHIVILGMFAICVAGLICVVCNLLEETLG